MDVLGGDAVGGRKRRVRVRNGFIGTGGDSKGGNFRRFGNLGQALKAML